MDYPCGADKCHCSPTLGTSVRCVCLCVCVSGTEQDKELSEGEFRTLDIYWLAVGLAHLRASAWFRKRLFKSAGCLLPLPTGAAAAAIWACRLPFVEMDASSLFFFVFSHDIKEVCEVLVCWGAHEIDFEFWMLLWLNYTSPQMIRGLIRSL